MCKISCLRVVLDEDTGTKGTRKVLHTLNGTITNCLTGTLQAMVARSAVSYCKGDIRLFIGDGPEDGTPRAVDSQ